ncbi:MAG: cation:proton antiporter [Clostridium sp.]|nr:MAG: cation:proton antiporter [Clostridium sp.]
MVVPRMIELKNKGLGARHNVAELIMAGSSCDDIFVIVLFYSFLSLNQNNTFSPLTLLQIPSSIILGIVLGILTGWIYSLIIKKNKFKYSPLRYIFLIGISFFTYCLRKIS